MIPKSGYRFSEKIMLQQKSRARWRFEEKSSRFRRTDVRPAWRMNFRPPGGPGSAFEGVRLPFGCRTKSRATSPGEPTEGSKAMAGSPGAVHADLRPDWPVVGSVSPSCSWLSPSRTMREDCNVQYP